MSSNSDDRKMLSGTEFPSLAVLRDPQEETNSMVTINIQIQWTRVMKHLRSKATPTISNQSKSTSQRAIIFPNHSSNNVMCTTSQHKGILVYKIAHKS
jgi:hypothetical protein